MTDGALKHALPELWRSFHDLNGFFQSVSIILDEVEQHPSMAQSLRTLSQATHARMDELVARFRYLAALIPYDSPASPIGKQPDERNDPNRG